MNKISIENLRHRAWILANLSIDTLNKLNDIIYENSESKPVKIENNPEDLTNISLQYIQNGIEIFIINNYILASTSLSY